MENHSLPCTINSFPPSAVDNGTHYQIFLTLSISFQAVVSPDMYLHSWRYDAPLRWHPEIYVPTIFLILPEPPPHHINHAPAEIFPSCLLQF